MKYIWWAGSIIWALLIFQLTTSPQPVVTDNSMIQTIIMVGGHILFFGIQAVLLLLALPTQLFRLSSSILAITLTTLYGLVIELVQRSIPGRSADPVDLLLDALGALVFVAIITLRSVHDRL